MDQNEKLIRNRNRVDRAIQLLLMETRDIVFGHVKPLADRGRFSLEDIPDDRRGSLRTVDGIATTSDPTVVLAVLLECLSPDSRAGLFIPGVSFRLVDKVRLIRNDHAHGGANFADDRYVDDALRAIEDLKTGLLNSAAQLDPDGVRRAGEGAGDRTHGSHPGSSAQDVLRDMDDGMIATASVCTNGRCRSVSEHQVESSGAGVFQCPRCSTRYYVFAAAAVSVSARQVADRYGRAPHGYSLRLRYPGGEQTVIDVVHPEAVHVAEGDRLTMSADRIEDPRKFVLLNRTIDRWWDLSPKGSALSLRSPLVRTALLFLAVLFLPMVCYALGG